MATTSKKNDNAAIHDNIKDLHDKSVGLIF